MPQEEASTAHQVLEKKAAPEAERPSEQPSVADLTRDALAFVSSGNVEGLIDGDFSALDPRAYQRLLATANRIALVSLGEDLKHTTPIDDAEEFARITKQMQIYQNAIRAARAAAHEGVEVTDEETATAQEIIDGQRVEHPEEPETISPVERAQRIAEQINTLDSLARSGNYRAISHDMFPDLDASLIDEQYAFAAGVRAEHYRNSIGRAKNDATAEKLRLIAENLEAHASKVLDRIAANTELSPNNNNNSDRNPGQYI